MPGILSTRNRRPSQENLSCHGICILMGGDTNKINVECDKWCVPWRKVG